MIERTTTSAPGPAFKVVSLVRGAGAVVRPRVAHSQVSATPSSATALCYMRCSSRTNAPGHSFERQRTAVKRYAETHGLTIAETFQDVVSGVIGVEGRPGLQALLLRLEQNGVATVLIENPSRLARSSLTHALLVQKMSAMGVDVISVSDGLNLTNAEDPGRKLLCDVMAALSAYERAMVTARLRAARDAKRATGARVEGQRPYGVDEAERATIARARQLRRRRRDGSRRSLAEVGRILDSEGHAPRRAASWSPASLAKILGRRMR